MLLVLDIGNTNIKVGLFREDKLFSSWRMTTDHKRTADEYGVRMESFFDHLKLATGVVDGIIMSSVIPSINYTMEHMCALYFHNLPVMQVGSGIKLGIKLRYDYPEQLGADRICNAAAAYAAYGGPCVVVDFGTATNFSVISDKGEFLGGLICPGFMVSADALVEKAAMLHKVEYVRPDKVVATNTNDAIQSGVIHGYAGQVEYIIHQIKREIGCDKVKVIATGGMANMVAAETACIDEVNSTLTLEGLRLIYRLNAPDKRQCNCR